jgi:uncharacterized membrane protein
MDAAYLHLVANHFPVILTIVGTVTVLLAMFTGRRGLWIYGCATLTLAGLTAPLAFFTGRFAEHVVEDYWYVTRDAIHAHEEAGELALWVLLAMGAVSAYAWLWRVRAPDVVRLPIWLRVFVVLVALAGSGTVSWASWQGGYVVHKASVLTGPRPAGVPVAPPPALPVTP